MCGGGGGGGGQWVTVAAVLTFLLFKLQSPDKLRSKEQWRQQEWTTSSTRGVALQQLRPKGGSPLYGEISVDHLPLPQYLRSSLAENCTFSGKSSIPKERKATTHPYMCSVHYFVNMVHYCTRPWVHDILMYNHDTVDPRLSGTRLSGTSIIRHGKLMIFIRKHVGCRIC